MIFSVVIPAFNEEALISSAIESVLRGSYPRHNYEIIVVDNNSTDGTSNAARAAGADHVIIGREQGRNMARNCGYRVARGAYVAFLDADSKAPPDWLSRIEKDFAAGTDVVAVSGPYDYGFTGIRRILELWYTQWLLPRVPDVLHFLFRKKAGVVIGGNCAVPRQVLDTVGGLPPLSFWGDDATLAMIVSRRCGKVVFDPYLRVASSPRRYLRDGFIWLTLRYAYAYLVAYFKTE